MTTLAEERVVPATVKERADVTNKHGQPEFKLSIVSPWFDSPKNLPQVIYVPDAVGASLRPGTTANFVLRSEGVINERYDGTKPWHHRWRFVRMADSAAPASPAPAAPALNGARHIEGVKSHAPQAAPAPSYDDARNRSIERQVAAKAATEIIVALIAKSKTGAFEYDAWTLLADHIDAWLRGEAPAPAPATEAEPEAGGDEGEDVASLPF